MSDANYYKTTDQKVIAALDFYMAKVNEIRAAANQFAEKFDGKPVFRNGFHGRSFAGLTFTPRKDTRIWTVPKEIDCYMQRPRKTITKATPEEKAELKALNDEWQHEFPREKAELEPVMNAVGTSWSDVIFGGGFNIFKHDDAVWVRTGAPVAEHMQEVKGSEYMAAEKALTAGSAG
jgi:hypothetical protein